MDVLAWSVFFCAAEVPPRVGDMDNRYCFGAVRIRGSDDTAVYDWTTAVYGGQAIALFASEIERPNRLNPVLSRISYQYHTHKIMIYQIMSYDMM